MSKKAKSEKMTEEQLIEEQAEEAKRINKECKTSFIAFNETGGVDFIDSGIEELNEVLGGKKDAGYPRGRMIELFGPENSGKTYMLTSLYAQCQKMGLKVAHYDAEGTYSFDFAELHGLQKTKLAYSRNNRAESLFAEIENLCKKNIFDVIGIDSLAALLPDTVMTKEMGDVNYSPLAMTISKCIPRLNDALSKSKTCLIFVNQLRDNVGAYGTPEKTPGGRTIKFYSSIRMDVRKKTQNKTERPDLFGKDNIPIGHVLRVKCVKNKVSIPYRECEIDLMYQKPRKTIVLIKEAMEKEIIKRQRDKNGELRGRKITYQDMDFIPATKEDYEEILLWIKENNLLCQFIVDNGIEDFDEFIECKDLTIEEVTDFLQKND